MSQTELPAPLALYHDPCQHKQYRVSCAVFDTVWQRGQGTCEICGEPEDVHSGRKLFIDHAAFVGMWAIRGLLCNVCNSTLGESNAFNHEAQAYLDHAWYLSALAEIGLEDGIPEPPPGSSLRTIFCTWQRVTGGWTCRCGTHRGVVKPWRHLRWRYGPFLMRTALWPQHPADR